MVSYYGRRLSVDTDAGLTGAGNTSNQRHSVFEPMPEHGWGYVLYLLAGKPIGGVTPTGRLSVATVDANGNPLDRMGWTGDISFSANMSSGGDGTLYSANIATIDTAYGFQSTAVQLWSGERYSLGFSATGGQLYHGMIAAANPGNNYSNNNLYKKNNGSTTPSEPLYTSSSNEGVMTVAIGYDPNDAPSTPTNRSPSGTITTTTPTFNSDFNDTNTNRGDALKQYQIQLRQVGQTALKWDTGTRTATTSETSAAVTTSAYGGSALTSGNSYEWRIRHRDRFNAWSNWSSWLTFTVAAAGAMGQGSSPIGKQLTQTPGPFVNPWSHPSGLSTNAVQIRLVSGSTILQTSPIITKTVANGANSSITWAESAFTALAYGSEMAYEVRGRDTANVWSDYGPNRTISINAYPNQPTITSPKNSVVLTALPKLIGKVTDPDNSAPLSLVQARIKSAAGAVLFTRTMTLQAGSVDTYEYQTTSTDLATFAVYKWDMVASDGSLTGPYSAEATFEYASGPVITITAPTEAQVLTTSTPTVTWTATGTIISTYAVLYDSNGTPIISSGNLGAGLSWAIPSGYLRNNKSYYIIVTATNNSGLTGNSANRNFSLVYTIPTAVANWSVTGLALAGDSKASVAFMTWTADTDPNFEYYIIRRRDSGTLAGDPSEVTLRRLTSISQVTFADTNPASGKTYIYSIARVIQSGVDYLESAAAEVELTIEFDHIIISSTKDGLTYRVSLYLMTANKVDWKDDRAMFLPWGESDPYFQFGSADYPEIRGTYRAITDRHGSARDTMENLRALKTRQIADADTLCYRDNRGRRVFGVMQLGETDQEMLRYGVDIGFIQTNFIEGEAPSNGFTP